MSRMELLKQVNKDEEIQFAIVDKTTVILTSTTMNDFAVKVREFFR
jgi:hypothetical protein